MSVTENRAFCIKIYYFSLILFPLSVVNLEMPQSILQSYGSSKIHTKPSLGIHTILSNYTTTEGKIAWWNHDYGEISNSQI